MSGMSLNGGGNMVTWERVHSMISIQSTVPQQPQKVTTTPAPPPPSSWTDSFADFAGLF